VVTSTRPGKDIRTDPRHVRNLAEIEVVRLQ